MKKTNVFFVESPLQALSAIEAKSLECHAENILIVKYQNKKNSENNAQLCKLIDSSHWDRVFILRKIHLIPQKLQRLFLLIHLWFFYSGRVFRFYIGEFRSETMHFCRGALNPEETFLLDDGAVIINVQKKYLENSLHWPVFDIIDKGFFSKVIDKLFFRVFKKNKVIRKPIHLFTAFSLSPVPGQRIIENSYLQLKSFNGTKKKIQYVGYHFGSKYSEAGVTSLDYELDFIKAVAGYYQKNNTKMIYIPHREESQEKLERILRLGGIEIKKIDVPSELYFTNIPAFPSCISAAYSTVLNNLSVMFEIDKVIAFQFDSSEVAQRYRSDVENVYKHYKSIERVLVVSLEKNEK